MLEDAGRKAGVSRGQAFEDFVEVAVCTLSGGEMEERYLQIVQGRYAQGEKGKRAIDIFAALFGETVRVMEETRADILGDLFQGAITYGEAGQYLTPACIADLMAQLTGGDGHTVHDPCCGTGRMLLAAAKENRHREFIGQDVDVRCVRITAINLALHNLSGYVIWGNSLMPYERKLVYRTGFNGKGVIREVKPEAAEPTVPQDEPHQVNADAPPMDSARETKPETAKKPRQQMLFEEGE